MDEEQILLLFKRIKTGPEGEGLIEYLETLSSENYSAWKKNASEMNDIHKGYAQAVDSLLEIFLRCDQKKHDQQEIDPASHY